MSNQIDDLIASSQKMVEEYQQKTIEAKKVVNQLATLGGRQPIYTDIEGVVSMGVNNIRNDQFFGMGVATAAAAYLKMKGSSAIAQEIFEGLNRGGFKYPDDWKEKLRLKNLAISLKKNTGSKGKFIWLESSNSFGLPEFYPDYKRTEAKKEVDEDTTVEFDNSYSKVSKKSLENESTNGAEVNETENNESLSLDLDENKK